MMAMVCVNEIKAGTDAPKKSKKAKTKHRRKVHHHTETIHSSEPIASGPVSNGGPFADVPPGHWAYDAVQKASEAGILQGWENKFHGGKIVNRFQMAVIIARMLDRVGVLKAKGKVITAEDIANLESLTIEFADELALLNVKVSRLEDVVSSMRRDVDLLKADMAAGGAKAGISGTAQARFAFTGDGSPGWEGGRFVGGAGGLPGPVGSFVGNGAAGSILPNPAGTTGITRYKGQTVSGNGTVFAPGAYAFDSRNFFTVSNFAINIDRDLDKHIHFHGQLDVNAEGSAYSQGATNASGYNPNSAFQNGLGNPLSGRGETFASSTSNIIVNEAYITWDDWFNNGVEGRLGIFALPMNFEVNGPSRTYQWTITPSIANSKWESIRPVGMDIFQNNEKDALCFYVGFFTPGDTSNGVNRSGTLLSAPTGFNALPALNGINVNNVSPTNQAQLDTLPNPAGSTYGDGRFPTPLGFASMTDAARGVDGQTLSASDLGYYGMVGTHPTNKGHEGFNWHVAYFDRNGDLRPSFSSTPSQTDWWAWQAAASYQFQKVLVAAQYYNSQSKNFGTGDILTTTDPRRMNTTPFLNFQGLDTKSYSLMALINWQFTPRGSVTARYEYAEDETGLAKLQADVFTLALNWRASDHGWFQLEWIAPETRARSENGVLNDTDINDDLVQVNYKLNW